MHNKKLRFVSFDQTKAYIYNHNLDIVQPIPLALLTNLINEYDLVVCNKQSLNKVMDFNIINNNIKDILYLYAMVFPVQFVIETINSLAKVFSIPVTDNIATHSRVLYQIYQHLLKTLLQFDKTKQSYILTINQFMNRNHKWEWYSTINKALQSVDTKPFDMDKIWHSIAKVDIEVTEGELSNEHDTADFSDQSISNALQQLTQQFDGFRAGQKEYALSIAKIFTPNNTVTTSNSELKEGTSAGASNVIKPNLVFAEAGTGVGKTLGYLAPILAYVQKHRNAKIVISTFSKALQQQIFKTLENSTKEAERAAQASIVKGAHNYVCLLNVDYLLANDNSRDNQLFLGLIFRWLQETATGDLLGSDFLPWLANLLPKKIVNNILNRKEECIYQQCRFYKKCFIVKIKEKARNSNIIISNHSLTLLKKFDSDYIIFDEAHNLYNVSDELYSQEISATKALQLKHWLIGYSSQFRLNHPQINNFKSRVRNIFFHINNTTNPEAEPQKAVSNESNNQTASDNTTSENEVIDITIFRLLQVLIDSTSFLPSSDYLNNIENDKPSGAFEEFLYWLYIHVLQHNRDTDFYYSIESPLNKLSDKLKESANKLTYQLDNILKLAQDLREALRKKLTLIDNGLKDSLKELLSTYNKNVIRVIEEFIGVLQNINSDDLSNYIDRFSIVRENSKIINIGYFQNHINPLAEFSKKILKNVKGIAFTSATLVDNTDQGLNQDMCLQKFGIDKDQVEVLDTLQIQSPFDYANNSQIIILKSDYSTAANRMTEALLQLTLAAKGGVLALFTSKLRLKKQFEMLSNHYLLKSQNIDIFSQHNENQYLNSIIDVFRENIDACLLGSDSCRDGIDIPGTSLRMVIYEKVPYFRQDILNKTRKRLHGKDIETEDIRLKLRQAFGRLIRSDKDKGLFVLLSPQISPEILSAFPPGIKIHTVTLEEAITLSEDFYQGYLNS